MKTVIMDMSGNYHMLFDYFRENPREDMIYSDFTSLQGTNIMLDSGAREKISSFISGVGPHGIHFLDSGNYHYLSYLFMEKIHGDFSLLLFDNHPDTTEPMEKDLLECGSWVREACEDFKNLRQVYLLGAAEEHIKEATPLPTGVKPIFDTSEISPDMPLYISIDKDVLNTEYAATDWDQGQMTLNELQSQLHNLTSSVVLGVDICGEKKSNPDFSELDLNLRTNISLLEEISCLLGKTGSISLL